MPYDPAKHHRQSIRLRGYDYSLAGAYFVTTCVHQGLCTLGEIVDGELIPSAFGRVVTKAWSDLPNHYKNVELHAFILMPNHVHGILLLTNSNGPDDTSMKRAGLKPAPTARHGLPEIIRGFKTFSARRINELKGVRGIPFWHRNYYEHIIRNERAYSAIRDYIYSNPLNWGADRLHPQAAPNQFNRHWR